MYRICKLLLFFWKEQVRVLEKLRGSLFSKLRSLGGAKRQEYTLCGPSAALAFNFLVSVSIILMNKVVLVKVGFNYPIFLSFLHYVFSWLIMAILRGLSILSLPPSSKSTSYFSLLSLGIVMSFSTGLANMSLKYNRAIDEEAGEIPVAFVVRRNGSKISEAAVVDFVAKQVAPYNKVRKVYFITPVPRSPSGKILRRKLKDLLISKF